MAVSKTAQRLIRDIVLNRGFCVGPDYPGNSIRKAFAELDRNGFLNDGTNNPSQCGVDFVKQNHLTIPLEQSAS
jgi:hypothetical protein